MAREIVTRCYQAQIVKNQDGLIVKAYSITLYTKDLKEFIETVKSALSENEEIGFVTEYPDSHRKY